MDGSISFERTDTYFSDHWALQPYYLSNPNVIAIIYFEGSDYAAYIHPHDKRGYRCIVRLINNSRMISTINRVFTSSERIGLALAMALLTEAYNNVVPIAQNIVAGNNAHGFQPNNGHIRLGTLEEPLFLHGHVFGRGNPEKNYVDDSLLDGPIPGMIFDLRAKTIHEKGNDTLVPWKPGEMEKVIRRIKIEINRIYQMYKNQGLSVFTENNSFEIYIIRHGKTDWNIDRKIQGHTDTPLNNEGERQALELRDKFIGVPFVRIISSDLVRAYSTAKLIVGTERATMIEKCALLRERCFGKAEGQSIDRFALNLQQFIDLDGMNQKEYTSFKWDEDCESYADVYQRVQSLIRRIVVYSSVFDGPLLFATHGGVIRSILYHQRYEPGFRWQVSNGGFVKLRVYYDGRIDIITCDGIKHCNARDSTFIF